jgi:hypothetical protein
MVGSSSAHLLASALGCQALRSSICRIGCSLLGRIISLILDFVSLFAGFISLFGWIGKRHSGLSQDQLLTGQ